MTDGPSADDVLDIIEKMRNSLPEYPLGSAENPYEMIVPGWVEDRAISEGTTSQEIADKHFRVKVRVVVVR